MPEHLTYRGDQRRFDPDHMLGPDRDRRRMRITSMIYSREVDRSIATLRAILPAEFRERVEPLVAQSRERERIRWLFNG